MWALSRRQITHMGVLSLLAESKEKYCYDSSTWFLLSHLRRLEINLVSETAPRATVSSELLRSTSNLSAYPFTILPESIKKSIVFCAPPPAASTAMIVTKRTDGSLCWNKASDDEVLDASFHVNSEAEQLLLCSPCVEPHPPYQPILLSIFNAHECGNPFQIDPTLQHIDMQTNTPLPFSFTSGLTTLVSQFKFKTFRWMRESDVLHSLSPPTGSSEKAENTSQIPVFSPRNDESPHKVLVESEITLYHVSQLPKATQAALLARVPRYVLFKCFDKPFVCCKGNWRSPHHLGFHEPLRRKNIPNVFTSAKMDNVSSKNQQEPLLWVDAADTNDVCIGAPLLRHIVRIEKIFHSSQLVSSCEGDLKTKSIVKT